MKFMWFYPSIYSGSIRVHGILSIIKYAEKPFIRFTQARTLLLAVAFRIPIEKYFGLIYLSNLSKKKHNSLISQRKFTHRNDFHFHFFFRQHDCTDYGARVAVNLLIC